ncbi:Gx transporter family protein [Elusimicrobiota bacterium]
MSSLRSHVLLSFFISAAVAVNIAEAFLPRILPWLKPGLANMLTLLALITIGPVFALKVAIGRVFLGSFIMGTFMAPSFYLSLTGAVASCMMMIVVYRPLGILSPIGVSVLGSLTHTITQLAVVYLLFVGHSGIFLLLPVIVISSIAAGLFNGYLVRIIPRQIADMSERRLFLVSTSPRRINIMKKAGLPVILVSPMAEEAKPKDKEDPIEYSLIQARCKINSVVHILSEPGIVIAADTVVEVGGKIFGKPSDEEEAEYMLRTLSGNEQKVHTAVVMRNLASKRTLEAVDTTILRMKELNEAQIEILKKQNMDKAGGYAIQGMRDEYFTSIQGSYSNVVGFPVELIRRMLKDITKDLTYV